MKHFIAFVLILLTFSCATFKANKTNHVIYWVDSTKIPCTGVGPMQCLKIQKGETINEENWQNFYSTIEGFEFEAGYIYKLIVNEESKSKKNLAADASTISYTLIKELEKQLDNKFLINNIWLVESINGETPQKKNTEHKLTIPQIEFNVAEMKVNGTDGCNNFFGSIKKIDAEELIFSPLASTKKACIGTDIPNKFNSALGKTSSYKIENFKLILFDAENNKILIFRKKDNL